MGNKTDINLKRQAMKGFLWMFSGSGIQSIMQFVVLIVLARLLDPETFGIVGAALVVISFAKIFATIGLGPALVQKKDINDKHIGTSFLFSLFLAICLGITVFIGSPLIASFFHIAYLSVVLKAMSVVFLLEGVAEVSQSLIQRDLLFNLLVRIQVLSYLAYGIVGTILAFMGLGVWSLVFAYLSRSFIKAILSLYLQPHKVRPGFDYSSFKELLYFSGGYSLTQISSEFTREGDNFIIGRILGADALGLYSRAYQLMVTPSSLLGKVLDKVLFPVVSKIQGEQKKVSYLYKEGIRLATTLMFPGSVFLAINAKNIILLLFGDQWLELTSPFQILALSLFLRSSYKIGDTIIKAKGIVYYRAMTSWIYAAMILLFTFIGVTYAGLNGAAAGVLIATLFNYIFITILATKASGIMLRKLLQGHLGGFVIAAIVWISSIPLKNLMSPFLNNFILELFVYIIVFLIIYLLCFLLFPYFFIGHEGERFVKKLKKSYKNRAN